MIHWRLYSLVCLILSRSIVCSFNLYSFVHLNHKRQPSPLKIHPQFAKSEKSEVDRVYKSKNISSHGNNSSFIHGATKLLRTNIWNLIGKSSNMESFDTNSLSHMKNHSLQSSVGEIIMTKQSQLQNNSLTNFTRSDVHSAPINVSHWHKFKRYIPAIYHIIRSNANTSKNFDDLSHSSSPFRDLHRTNVQSNSSSSVVNPPIDIERMYHSLSQLSSNSSISVNSSNNNEGKYRNGTIANSLLFNFQSIFRNKQALISNRTDLLESSLSNNTIFINESNFSRTITMESSNLTLTQIESVHSSKNQSEVDNLKVFDILKGLFPSILSSKQSMLNDTVIDNNDNIKNEEKPERDDKEQDLTAVEQTILKQVSLTLGHREGFLPPNTIAVSSSPVTEKPNKSDSNKVLMKVPIWQWFTSSSSSFATTTSGIHLFKEVIDKLEEETETSEDNITIAEEITSTENIEAGSHLFEMKQNLMPNNYIETNDTNNVNNNDNNSNINTLSSAKPSFTDGIAYMFRRSIFAKLWPNNRSMESIDNSFNTIFFENNNNTIDLLSYLYSLSRNDTFNDNCHALNISISSLFSPENMLSRGELYPLTLNQLQELVISAALAVKSEKDTIQFLKIIGLEPLYAMLFDKNQTFSNNNDNNILYLKTKTNVIKAFFSLTRHYKPLADEIGQKQALINVFCELLEAPSHITRRRSHNATQTNISITWNFVLSFFNKDSNMKQRQDLFQAEFKELKDAADDAQRETVALVQWLVRCSEVAVGHMRHSQRLRNALYAIMHAHDNFNNNTNDDNNNVHHSYVDAIDDRNISINDNTFSKTHTSDSESAVDIIKNEDIAYINTINNISNNVKLPMLRKRNATILVDYSSLLKPLQMARVSHWGLGGVPWQSKRHIPGHRGIRILSFDGGGTRGVVSIAYLKELFTRVAAALNSNIDNNGINKMISANACRPSDYFDIICGTSTGGIIAMLLGGQCRSIGDSETLYDEFIDKIFATKSNFKLVREQAAYDETQFEKILYRMCGESLMLDTNQQDCARVFCVSTKINTYPPVAHLWRNYNYPPLPVCNTLDSKKNNSNNNNSRYPGTFRANTMTAVRATTAAPTFFTPVPFHGDLFSDGALVANNPTAIAVQEAKLLFPDTPIECVVSIGTGSFFTHRTHMQTLGWDTLVNQLIASSTDTEDVHHLLQSFLPNTQYFRFNPVFPEDIPIDVKDKNVLLALKRVARVHYEALEQGEEGSRYKKLVQLLSGTSPSTSS